uniref:Uncharacterized protein n=1 Tax=Anguilla anguilla TaxID=7936 RepID=A0A0E9VVR8_ANGAN
MQADCSHLLAKGVINERSNGDCSAIYEAKSRKT